MYITVGGVTLNYHCAHVLSRNMPCLFLQAAILVALTYHLIAYERGRDQAALDFAITVTGLTYIGWIGSYLFDLRNLPEGGWWFMLVMFLCLAWRFWRILNWQGVWQT